MSSTVGYGVEVTGNVFGEAFDSGELEMEIERRYSGLLVTRSRAEYGDEERVFVLLRNSVTQAGGDSTAASLNLKEGDTNELFTFIREAGLNTEEPRWWLVDYYVYS